MNLTPNELNDLLAKSRDKKFRKRTDSQMEGMHNRSYNTEWRKKQQLHNTRIARDPEMQRKRKQALHEKLADPEYKQWRSDNVKQSLSDPDVRKRMSESARRRANTDEYKQLASERFSAPEFQEKRFRSQCDPIYTNVGVFHSTELAAQALNSTNTTVRKCALGKQAHNPFEIRYFTWAEYDAADKTVNQELIEQINLKHAKHYALITPLGIFKTAILAAEAHGISVYMLRDIVKGFRPDDIGITKITLARYEQLTK